MRSYLNILFVLVVSLFVHAKSGEENYKIVTPKFVPQNSIFDVSIITSNPYADAEILEIYILPEDKISLEKIELRSFTNNSVVPFSSAILEGEAGRVIKGVVNLTRENIAQDIFFQLLFNLKTESSASVRFLGIYKKGGEVLGYIKDNTEDKFINSFVRTFKPQRIAGKNLQFENYSSLEISFKEEAPAELLTEFWIKFSRRETSFLKIKNQKTASEEFELFTNNFQMMYVSSKTNIEEYTNPFFTGKNCWYHISILSSEKNNSISFFINGNFISKYYFNSFLENKSLVFEFINEADDKKYWLEQFRIINYDNDIEKSFLNRSYLDFIVENSSLINTIRFDDQKELSAEYRSLNIKNSRLRFVRSDAPLFARAPELNINLLSNSYELEWSGGDYKHAENYMLEKSSGTSDYAAVYTVRADNESEKKYTYLDKKDNSADVVFYRVKQINYDGSVVYSSQVKVGQRLAEPFVVEQNFPNPFNPKTSILVEIIEDSEIEITIYNLEGRELSKIYKGFLTKGVHKFDFDGTEIPSGIYLYKIASPNFTQTRKMILAK